MEKEEERQGLRIFVNCLMEVRRLLCLVSRGRRGHVRRQVMVVVETGVWGVN